MFLFYKEQKNKTTYFFSRKQSGFQCVNGIGKRIAFAGSFVHSLRGQYVIKKRRIPGQMPW
jgi:hypothetical protein